jgi:hypothetical protein
MLWGDWGIGSSGSRYYQRSPDAVPQWRSKQRYCTVAIPLLVAKHGGSVPAGEAKREVCAECECSEDTVDRARAAAKGIEVVGPRSPQEMAVCISH